MLSNLIITSHRFILIVDELKQEKVAHKLQSQLLSEQGQDEMTTKILPLSADLKNRATLYTFINECAICEVKWNVLLPPLSDLLCYQPPAMIFQFVQQLRRCEGVQRVFLWLSTGNIIYPRAEYLIAAFEHMADLVLRFETSTGLSIATRKPGGNVTNKSYVYRKSKSRYHIESVKVERTTLDKSAASNADPIGTTFKIQLDEEELQARNALKLPYEKVTESKESAIIYTPDAADDYDEEDDLDDDLCI